MAVSIKTKQGVNIRTGNESYPDVEVYCKSTDTKPIQGMRNAYTLLEWDTQNIFLFDEDAKEWALISEGKK